MRNRQTGLITADRRNRLETPGILRVLAAMRETAVRLCLALAVTLATVFVPGFAAGPKPALARTTDGPQLAGATADLFKAVEVNDMPGVKAAIAAGADINAKNAAGKTPADLAVDRGHFIIAHFLLSQRAPGAATARSAAPKAGTPAPRRLAPVPPAAIGSQTRAPRTVTPSLQPKPRFTAPPAKPAPTTTAPLATPPRRPTPVRGLTPPPRTPLGAAAVARLKPAPAKPSSRFALPPRKPPQPLPEAVEIAEAPGGVADLPPTGEATTVPDGLSAAPPPDETAAEVSRVPPAAGDVVAFPSDAGLPTEIAGPAQPAAAPEPELPQAETKTAIKKAPAAPLGQVGQFFRNMLDLVTPDDPVAPNAEPPSPPSAPPAATRTARDTMAKPAAPTSTAKTGAPTPSDDAQLAADLERSLGLSDKGAPARPDDIVELKELEQSAGAAPRRIPAPAVSTIRRSVPAPKVEPPPLKAPAKSTAARTLDRIGGLVGAKPKEDEFGLPQVEITGPPSEAPAVSEPPIFTAPPTKTAAMPAAPADEEPSLESLLGDSPASKPADDLPATQPLTGAPPKMAAKAKTTSAPNINDTPGPERNDPIAIDEDLPPATSAPTATAPAPKATPKTPVASAAMPASKLPAAGKSRYMSTTERLRRLNEALSRDVPLDGPMRRDLPKLDNRMTDYMITGLPPRETIPRGKPPPSSLPTRPLTHRETPSDRFIDRLERIRRNVYEEERAPPATDMARATPPSAAQAPASVPASVPAQTAMAPTAADAKPAEKNDSALSKLVKFFRQAEGQKSMAAGKSGTSARTDGRTGDSAIPTRPSVPLARQAEYRAQPDLGAAKETAAGPKPLADQAVQQLADEPKPGQSAGKMPPGFLEHLSRLFTDQKVAEKGWAAEVELLEPKSAPAPPEPTLKPVSPNTGVKAANTAATTSSAAEMAATSSPPATPSLPPPRGELPANAGSAWTTTVEMTTDTGDPMVLGVVKTPVPPGAQPPPVSTPAQPAGDLPPAQGENIVINEDGLPPAEGENIAVSDDLPPAQGEAPVAKSDDLPPAQGETEVVVSDAPASAGRKPAAKPTAKPPYSDPLQRPMTRPAAPASAAPPLTRTAELNPAPTMPHAPLARRGYAATNASRKRPPNRAPDKPRAIPGSPGE